MKIAAPKNLNASLHDSKVIQDRKTFEKLCHRLRDKCANPKKLTVFEFYALIEMLEEDYHKSKMKK